MTFNNVSLLNVALNASDLRQKAISNNISNINTPGFKVERVSFEDKLKKAMSKEGNELLKTDERHFSVNGNVNDFAPEVIRKKQTSVKQNGNNVDLDVEMSEKSVNELYYSALTKQVNHELSQINYVINH